MAHSMTLRKIGQIKKADLTFGDLTVLVGPQASGKTIALEWLKLICDTGHVQALLRQYGIDWHRKLPEFLDLYFGEGMRSLWAGAKSEVRWDGRIWDARRRVARMARNKRESVFLIPAQRVLTLRDGWPRPFSDYRPGDPFSVRWFSEKLRLLMEEEPARIGDVFPSIRRLKKEYRTLLEQTVFGPFRLTVDESRPQKRLILGRAESEEQLPYMVWSTGQREFVPLLLGLYWLMPSTKVSCRAGIEWVIIEEPEMGMHPRAIGTVLLLILELLNRGYRVCISTHSPQVLDLVWVLHVLHENNGDAREVLNVFDAPRTQVLRKVAESVVKKTCKVYYFEGEGGTVRDITGLDPNSLDEQEASWGRMLEFSGRANEAVASVMANADHRVGK